MLQGITFKQVRRVFSVNSLMLSRLLLFVVIFSFSSTIYISNAAEQENIKFTRMYIKDGLSHTFCTHMCQDSKGFIWVGTQQGGINKYDGLFFKHYKNNVADTNSIAANRIAKIVEDSKQNLWFCTSNSLSLYNRDKDNFYNLKINVGHYSGRKQNNTNYILEDSNNVYWLGTSLGLSKMNLDTVNPYNSTYEHYAVLKDGKRVSPGIVLSMIKVGPVVWIGTRSGLYFLQEGSNVIQRYSEEEFEAISISSFYRYNDSEILVSMGANLALLSTNILKPQKSYYKLFNPELFSADGASLAKMVPDKKGNLYITSRNGLFVLTNFRGTNSRLIHYLKDKYDYTSLSNNIVFDVLFDKSGVLWVSTAYGLNKYDANRHIYKAYYGDVSDDILMDGFRVFLDNEKRDHVIVGAQQGFFVLNLNTNSYKISPLNTTPNAQCRGIAHFKNNIYLAAYYNPTIGGLYTMTFPPDFYTRYNFEDIKYKHYHFPGMKNQKGNMDYAKYIMVDTDSIIWLATRMGGLIKAQFVNNNPNDSLIITQFMHNANDKHSIASNNIICMFEDDNGEIWVGTRGNGISIYNKQNNTFRKPLDADGNDFLGQYIINSMAFDNDVVYIGTQDVGVFKYNLNTKEHENINEEDGLISNSVWGVRLDDYNSVWISTLMGISKLNKKTSHVVNFNVDNGLHGYSFLESASFEDRDGNFYFGGTTGFSVLKADFLKRSYDYKPEVVINQFKVRNKSITPGDDDNNLLSKNIEETKSIIIPHAQNDFTFEFAALSFSLPQKNQYKYRLMGYDDDWIYTNADKPFAKYSNIPGGKYVFMVKASNFEGIWNENATEIDIQIISPFWKTWWFALMVAFGVAVLVYLIIKYRERQAIIIRERLELQVEERTAKLNEANQELEEQQEEIKQQNEEILTINQTLEEQTEQITKSFKSLEVLSSFGQKVTATLNMGAINKMIYEYASSIIPINAFGIGLYDEKINSIVYPSFYEGENEMQDIVKSLNDENSLTSWCFNHQKPVYINDFDLEYKQYIKATNPSTTKKKANSRLHVPLTVEKKKIGLLVINCYEKYAFSKEDFTNIQTLASYISIALDNANAYAIINETQLKTEKSINYARNIQNAFLPSPEEIKKFVDSFVLYKPKDIVSGDFYWFYPIERDDSKELDVIIGVIDCTGHGVPGALMSIIGNNLLNTIINIKHIYNPAQILELLNIGVQVALRQDETKNNDGMDVALCRITRVNKSFKVIYSGAKRPLCLVRNDKPLESHKGSRSSIGGLQSRKTVKEFEQLEVTLEKGDSIYLFSDGYTDQNSPTRDKFSREKFYNLVQDIQLENMAQQQRELSNELERFQEDSEQRDDITVIGIRL